MLPVMAPDMKPPMPPALSPVYWLKLAFSTNIIMSLAKIIVGRRKKKISTGKNLVGSIIRIFGKKIIVLY
jgi:hypothetical protein